MTNNNFRVGTQVILTDPDNSKHGLTGTIVGTMFGKPGFKNTPYIVKFGDEKFPASFSGEQLALAADTTEATQSQVKQFRGISSIGSYPGPNVQITVEAIERLDRRVEADRVCRVCGNSEQFDGVPMQSDDLCIDCGG